MAAQSEKRTYKIGEVCKKAEVQPYVLRYWETEFAALSPSKSGGGQRLYSQHEVDVVLRIKELLYDEGFTIAGAKKRLDAELEQGKLGSSGEVRETAAKASAGAESPGATKSKPLTPDARAIVDDARKELRKLLEMLDGK